LRRRSRPWIHLAAARRRAAEDVGASEGGLPQRDPIGRSGDAVSWIPMATEELGLAATTPDLTPDLKARLRAAGLAATEEEVAQCDAETPRIVDELLGKSGGIARQLLRLVYLSIPLRPCKLEHIPEPARSAARAIGFRPLVFMLHGPVLPMATPNFVGPEGFIKLEVYGGQRIYLFTYFDDGTEVETAAVVPSIAPLPRPSPARGACTRRTSCPRAWRSWR
jgi:hypothetical protein